MAAPDMGMTRPLGWTSVTSLSHRHTQPGAILHVAVMQQEQDLQWVDFTSQFPAVLEIHGSRGLLASESWACPISCRLQVFECL